MGGLIRKHFRADGYVKKSYTKREALMHARQQKMDAYKCDFCPNWHLGKPK